MRFDVTTAKLVKFTGLQKAVRVFAHIESRPMRTALRWQVYATAGLGLLAGSFTGIHGAVSAILGGIINQIADFAYAKMASARRIRTAGGTLRALFRAEAARVVLIVFQMGWVLTSYKDVVHVVFFISFAVSVIVFRMAILVKE
jgi:ATP synthase protein I